MKYLGVRLKQTLSFEIIVSVLCSMPFYFGILKQTAGICSMVMIVGIVINIVRLFLDLRAYCRHSRANLTTYYITNLTVVLIIAALTWIFTQFNVEPLFTWLFFPYKLFNISLGVPKLVSALAVSTIFALVTVCVPAFVKMRK